MSTETKYKLLLFFKRNPALTPAQFRAHYEASHAPLVHEVAKTAPGLERYIRRYLQHDTSDPAHGNPFTVFGDAVPTIDFDMINEVTFASRADAREFERQMYDIAETAERTLADEETLFVKTMMRGMVVEEVGVGAL